MDQFLLLAVATEAAGRLVDQEIQRVSYLGHSRYLLRFATASRDNLLLSVRPDLPRFHLLPRSGRILEAQPDRFAAHLDQELEGAVLLALEPHPWDRVVEMRFRLTGQDGGAVDRRLVIELFGRSANIVWLDPDGLILARARGLKSGFRAPPVGAAYEPPVGRETYDALGRRIPTMETVLARWGEPPKFLEPLSPILAQDLRRMADRSEEAVKSRLQQILDAARDERWEPTVYAVRPLAQFQAGDRLERNELLLAPLPLQSAPWPAPPTDAVMVHYASPSEAAADVYGLMERLRDFLAIRDHHAALIRKEADRLTTLIPKLEGEMQRALGADRYRRLAEALLAALTTARVEGARAYVTDPSDPAGAALAVPIDPAVPLSKNAQLLFDRYKKGKRGRTTIQARLAAARRKLQQWQELAGQATDARTPADLEALREAMAGLGLLHPERHTKRAAPPSPRETPARVRRHVSRDGLIILVGRSGAENDTLTFRVASPWDFWLHTADHSGAHVVVRNPQKLKVLPDRTLRVAAEIAAFYSGARGSGSVEVHYTQRKHVHKRKGMPRGQVLLRRFRSTRVTPRLPAPTIEEV